MGNAVKGFISRDVGASVSVFSDEKPTFDKMSKTFQLSSEGSWSQTFETEEIPEGHLAECQLVLEIIQRPIDCTPGPIPELWAVRSQAIAEGSIAVFSGPQMHTWWPYFDIDDAVELPMEHKCRIVWDEKGIRLIGTPEPIQRKAES